MKNITSTVALFLLSVVIPMWQTNCFAQNYTEMKIWEEGLPNSNGKDLSEPYDDEKRNYEPTIRIYLPEKDKATHQAVLCVPGGGYGMVCSDTEGYSWAPYFLERGIALIVLKYRLPFGYSSVPAADAYEAIRIIRRHAKEWNINPQKVGIMGHSAGGHLTATVATHATGDAKPDFQILFYPVITMDKRYTHMGTHNNLIGENPSPELELYYSCEKQVKKGDPPAIILTTNDDKVVPPENSVNYYFALQQAGISASLHVYPTGAHGFSNHTWFHSHDTMLSDLFSWLDSIK